MSEAGESTHHVLLVEDNPGDAGLVEAVFLGLWPGEESLRHVVSLEQARQHLAVGRFDAVLLDLQLPDGAGVDCVDAIRAVASTVPIVVLTGFDDETLARACIHAGAQDYLSKQALQGQSLRRAIDYAVSRVQAAAERDRAEQLRMRLAAIVESSYDAIVSSTTDGVITSWNRGAERIFGYTAEEALGRRVGEVIRPEPEADASAARPERRVFQARRGADAGGVEEVLRHHKDGHLLTLSVVTSVVLDEHGKTVGLAAILRDVTEHRRRDAELARLTAEEVARGRRLAALTDRLRTLQEDERTRISREVHDELGQLLTGLKLEVGFAQRKLAEMPGMQALANRLLEAMALADQTIGTVQRIALELRPSALDALGLVAAMRDEVRRFEQRAGLAVRLDLQHTPAPNRAAATAVFRILQKLLTNVARHARATAVMVAWREEGEGWTLEVGDNGVGLPPDAGAGASLGLMGMTERAQALGGRFDLLPGPGGGSIGRLTLPQAGNL